MTPLLLALALSGAWTPPTPPAFARPEVLLEDLDRFPPEWLADDQGRWLAARGEWLTAQVDLHGGDPYWAKLYDPAIRDNAARKAAWALLAHAHWQRRLACMQDEEGGYYGDSYGDACRDAARSDLAELRRLLGADAYRAGWMPALIGPRFARPVP